MNNNHAPDVHIEDRPWGRFVCYAENQPCTVKLIEIEARQALSLQFHNQRAQQYILADSITIEWSNEPVPEDLTKPRDILEWYERHRLIQQGMRGDEFFFAERVIHRATNEQANQVRYFEVAYGHNDESDIIRLADRYGRTDL